MPPKHITVGRFGKPYGIKGWIKINSATEPAENIFLYQPLQVNLRGTLHSIEVVENRVHGDGFVVHIANYDTPETVKLLSGKEIVVDRNQLPSISSDEYYWADLEGLEVFTTQGILLGTVDYLIESGANDILVVKGEREHLIPYIIGQVIIEVDLNQHKIKVDWDPAF